MPNPIPSADGCYDDTVLGRHVVILFHHNNGTTKHYLGSVQSIEVTLKMDGSRRTFHVGLSLKMVRDFGWI